MKYHTCQSCKPAACGLIQPCTGCQLWSTGFANEVTAVSAVGTRDQATITFTAPSQLSTAQVRSIRRKWLGVQLRCIPGCVMHPSADPRRSTWAGSLASSLILKPRTPDTPLLSLQVAKFRVQAIREDSLVVEAGRELTLDSEAAAGATGLQLAFTPSSGNPQRLKFRLAATDGTFAGDWSAESNVVTIGEPSWTPCTAMLLQLSPRHHGSAASA